MRFYPPYTGIGGILLVGSGWRPWQPGRSPWRIIVDRALRKDRIRRSADRSTKGTLLQALVWNGQSVSVLEHAEPAADPGWVVVRVELAGVCNTDLEITRGYMGFRGVLGHEFVATVAEGPSEWLNRRTLWEINFACRDCDTCRSGRQRHCPTRRVMGILNADGAFAEYVALPVANLHAVPDSLPDERAVFCEPVAAACQVLENIEIDNRPGCTVLGDGKLGLLIAQVLSVAGAKVLAVGRHPENLEILARRGIETALLGDWIPDHVDSAEVVVEATGRTEGLQLAVEATRPCGTLVLKSTLARSPDLDLSQLVIDEIRLLGSRCGPFAPALRMLDNDDIEVEALISENFDLARAEEAIERAAQPGVRKVLIRCNRLGGEGQ